jgi:hypothetical protein
MLLNMFLPLKFKDLSYIAEIDQSATSLIITDTFKGIWAQIVPTELINLPFDRNDYFVVPQV